jgi:hypothetical protein
MQDTYIVTSIGSNWCIVNTRTNRSKKIGAISKGKGVNYYDRAKKEAAKRMECSVDDIKYVPSYFEKLLCNR